MVQSFQGKLTLGDGSIVNAVLNIGDDVLTVGAEGATVGSWPLKYCRVARKSETEFALSIDGEPTSFVPADPYRFAMVAAEKFHGSSIADRIGVIRSMPLEEPEPAVTTTLEAEPVAELGTQRPLPWAGIVGATVLIGAIALGVWVMTSNQEPEPVVIVAPTTTVLQEPREPEVFTLTPDGLRRRWNDQATLLRGVPVIGGRFGAGRFEHPLSDEVTLSGTTDADGTVKTMKLAITPTADPDATRATLAYMGVAMLTADPTLTVSDRTRLIQLAGLVGFPGPDLDLEGLDGEVVENGIRYWLRFLDVEGTESDLLIFGIDPAD
ncbi:MAG: hypothetical protein OEX04_05340 [Acidimicrobiia bacterium]|nr:hypothetical protein [Acidimicrobiia bacterium]MDH4306883.1 hypothetical protein [Acidimicrobiia bacterium]MDH5294541.1 hypothetical protein [Acidimicrobiia bacterium]